MSQPTTTFILDGIWGRPRRFRRLREVLANSCGPSEMFEYDSSGRIPFEQLGQKLADAIQRHGQPINIIGFSMGGLVIRAAHLLCPELPLRRAVFLNSPHRGSWLAHLLPWPGVRQMRPGSDFIRQISAANWTLPTLAVWCPWDLMILPGTSARFACASQTICTHVPAHIWPIYSRRLHQRIATFLACE